MRRHKKRMTPELREHLVGLRDEYGRSCDARLRHALPAQCADDGRRRGDGGRDARTVRLAPCRCDRALLQHVADRLATPDEQLRQQGRQPGALRQPTEQRQRWDQGDLPRRRPRRQGQGRLRKESLSGPLPNLLRCPRGARSLTWSWLTSPHNERAAPRRAAICARGEGVAALSRILHARRVLVSILAMLARLVVPSLPFVLPWGRGLVVRV